MSKKYISYYKGIPLLPTAFTLEVIIGKRQCDVIENAIHNIGKKKKFWKKWASPNCCIYTKIKGVKRIIVILEGFDPAIIAHEATHVTWELDRNVRFNFDLNHHEIQAYMIEYIVEEILKIKEECTAKETKKTT